MPVYFSASTDGLTARVAALTAIVGAVTAYFTAPARAIAVPVPVFAGDWETWRHTSEGPPGRVIIGYGDFQDYDPGSYPGAAGLRYTPGLLVELDATHAVPVVGVRAQMLRIWVLGLPNAGAAFETDVPGSAYALAQQEAAMGLADLTWAALRDAFGHPLGPAPWKPMGPERGELGYGAVLVGQLGPVPVPIFGDVATYATPTELQAALLFATTTTGDTVTAS